MKPQVCFSINHVIRSSTDCCHLLEMPTPYSLKMGTIAHARPVVDKIPATDLATARPPHFTPTISILSQLGSSNR